VSARGKLSSIAWPSLPRVARASGDRASLVPSIALGALLASCATIAADGHGDANLPDEHDGPFRPLKHGLTCVTNPDGTETCTGVDELPAATGNGLAQYPRAPKSRSPSVLTRGKGGDDLRVVMYVARDQDTSADRIARMESADARSFDDVAEVLTAESGFEGLAIGDPWAMEVDQEVWLYYAIHPDATQAAQTPGISRAKSIDGLDGRAFAKDGAIVVIDGAPGAWETEPPRAPSVVRADDGTFHLFYASGDSIGEAVGPDGVHFTRLDADPTTTGNDPVLSPSPQVDLATLPSGVRPPFDDLAVDDPSVARIVTVASRSSYRLHYTGRDRRDGTWIGFAGRFGEAGAFGKDPGSVYGGKLDPLLHSNAPAVARFPDFSLLYCNVDYNNEQAIGLGIAPANIKLPIAQ
jgi:hypothetical protein